MWMGVAQACHPIIIMAGSDLYIYVQTISLLGLTDLTVLWVAVSLSIVTQSGNEYFIPFGEGVFKGLARLE